MSWRFLNTKYLNFPFEQRLNMYGKELFVTLEENMKYNEGCNIV